MRVNPGKQNEIGALANLLAEVVLLTEARAWFPSHLEEIAEQAQEHTSVRLALSILREDEQESPAAGGRPAGEDRPVSIRPHLLRVIP